MRYLFILLAVLTYGQLNAQSLDKEFLKKCRTGVFTYEGKEREVQIIRTQKKQVEIFNDGASKAYLKIEWQNDSTYTLTLYKAKNVPNIQIGQRIESHIVSCKGDRYVCFYTSGAIKGDCVIIKLK